MQKKVLVADDSATVQKVVNITLAKEKYTLVEAKDLGKTIQLLQSDNFDLILLDFQLSGVAGGEVLRKIKKLAPTTKILLMLSAFDDLDEQVLKDVGVDDKITKPFESLKLLEKCRKILEVENSNVDELIGPEIAPEISLDSDLDSDDEEVIIGNWTESRPGLPNRPLQFSLNNDLNEGDGFKDEKSDIIIKDVKINWTQAVDANGEAENYSADHSEDMLAEEIEGWGLSVPGVIGSTEQQGDLASMELPPVLDDIIPADLESDGISYHEEQEDTSDSTSFGSDNTENLEIPEEIDFNSYSPRSKLVRLEELNGVDGEDKNDDDLGATGSSIKIPIDTNSGFDLKNTDNENNIESDRDVDPERDKFWEVDAASEEIDDQEQMDNEDSNDVHQQPTHSQYELRNVGFNIDNITGVHTVVPQDDSVNGVKEVTSSGIHVDESLIRAAVEETLKTALNQFNRQDFLAEIKKELLDLLLNSQDLINELRQEIVKALLAKKSFMQELQDEIVNKLAKEVSLIHHQTSEKVAWEVIPDLAENLIRKEIKQISDSLQ